MLAHNCSYCMLAVTNKENVASPAAFCFFIFLTLKPAIRLCLHRSHPSVLVDIQACVGITMFSEQIWFSLFRITVQTFSERTGLQK